MGFHLKYRTLARTAGVALCLAALGGCSDEKNGYANQPVAPSGKTPTTSTGNKTNTDTTDTGGDTHNILPTDGTPSLDIDPMLDTACTSLSKVTYDQGVAQELAVLCVDGKATDRMKELVGKAYNGSGTADFGEITPHSSGSNTEVLVSGAVKFPISMAKFQTRADAVHTMVVSGSGVTITNSVLSTTPKKDDTYLEVYKTKQNIATVVMSLPINDDIIQNEALFKISSSPNIVFMSRVKTPGESANDDNVSAEQVTFIIETAAATTYAFQVMHLSTANMGFASTAEEKIKTQPPIVAAQYYKTIMGQ